MQAGIPQGRFSLDAMGMPSSEALRSGPARGPATSALVLATRALSPAAHSMLFQLQKEFPRPGQDCRPLETGHRDRQLSGRGSSCTPRTFRR